MGPRCTRFGDSAVVSAAVSRGGGRGGGSAGGGAALGDMRRHREGEVGGAVWHGRGQGALKGGESVASSEFGGQQVAPQMRGTGAGLARRNVGRGG